MTRLKIKPPKEMGTDELLLVCSQKWLTEAQLLPYENALLQQLLDIYDINSAGKDKHKKLALKIAIDNQTVRPCRTNGAPKKWMGEEGLILFAAVQAAATKLGSENKAILYIQEDQSYFPRLERPVGIKARYYEIKSKHPILTLIEDDFATRFGKQESYIKNIETLHQQIVEHYAALYEK